VIRDIKGFDIALQEYGDKRIPDLAMKQVRAIALEAAAGVILSTPVREGRARGNWQVTEGEPAEGVVDDLDKAGTTTLARAAAVIQRAARYPIIWLHNGLPYIRRLEDGWSRQAPHGMVSTTLARLRRRFGR
jgi:hypothetical protein